MIDIELALRSENPKARTIDLAVFANTIRIYREASANIAREGAIVFHPRTGTPMDNPYLKVQGQQGAIIAKMRAIKSDKLMAALDAEAAPK